MADAEAASIFCLGSPEIEQPSVHHMLTEMLWSLTKEIKPHPPLFVHILLHLPSENEM